MIGIEVSANGPIFDGRADLITDRMCDDIAETVAQHGYDLIQQRLGHVLRHPTGYYQSRIQVNDLGSDQIINDSDVIYGPWLEGVGSRNKTTRFKGYHTFRLVAEQLKGTAHVTAEQVAGKYVRGL